MSEYRYLVEDELNNYYEIVASQIFKIIDLSFADGLINANSMSFPLRIGLLTSRYYSPGKHNHDGYQIKHLLNYAINISFLYAEYLKVL